MVAQPHTPIKPDPPLRLLTAFYEAFPGMEPQAVMLAPGRDIWVAASPAEGRHYRLYNADQDQRTLFTWRDATHARTALRRPLPRWARYPAAVIAHLCASQPALDHRAVNLVLAADEAPGLRREFGLGIAVAALWHELAGMPTTPDALTKLVDHVRRTRIEA